jgi:hypothetical protein
MSTKKLGETIINLSPTEMFAGVDAVILNKLKTSFEGTCRNNSLIVNIIKIVERSKVKISKSQLDGSGSVNVKFLADIITYSPGDILPVCEIIKVDRGHKIMCEYGEHTIIWLQGNRALQSLRPKQKVPVIVTGVSYEQLKKKIVVYGAIYTYPMKFPMFVLSDSTDNMSSDDIALLQSKIDIVSKEKEIFDKTDPKVRKFLTEVYYPFHKKSVDMHNLASKEVDILHMLDAFNPKALTSGKGVIKKDMILFRHSAIEKSTDEVFTISYTDFDKLSKPNTRDHSIFDTEQYRFEIIHETPIRVLFILLEDYRKFLYLIGKLAAEFNTERSLESQNNIWNIYKNIKRDV